MAAPSSNLDSRLIQRKGVEVRTFAGGAVLADLSTGRCFRLNPVGAAVWRALEAPLSPSALHELIANRYGAPLGQVQSDVTDLLESLLREGLVEAEGTPAP
jgi:hypothetical protein